MSFEELAEVIKKLKDDAKDDIEESSAIKHVAEAIAKKITNNKQRVTFLKSCHCY